MIDLRELDEIKTTLLEAWEEYAEQTPESSSSVGARLQTMPKIRRPRPGLAVGHSINRRTGNPRIEFRVRSGKGKAYAQARELQAKAQSIGLDTILRVFRRPKVPSPSDAIPHSPLLGGHRKPLHIGASVAHERGSAGSLGGFVQLEDGDTGILSCVHVLAWPHDNPRAAVGDPIAHPGDQDPKPAGDRIAELTGHFAPFISRQRKNLDAAIARLHSGVDHTGNVIPNCPEMPAANRGVKMGPPMKREEVETEMRVCKIGRTTGFTEATLSALDFQNLEVALGTDRTQEWFVFSGIYEVQWDKGNVFTASGDSGALVLSRDGMRPIGINFCAISGAGSRNVSYVVPWWRIEDTYHVKFL